MVLCSRKINTFAVLVAVGMSSYTKGIVFAFAYLIRKKLF